jgi:hypothetical protein
MHRRRAAENQLRRIVREERLLITPSPSLMKISTLDRSMKIRSERTSPRQ